MSKLIRVFLSVYKWTAAGFLERVTAVYEGLNGNPAYPNSPVPMPEFKAAIDDFSAKSIAAIGGGVQATADRHAAGDRVSRMVRQLAHYVEAACNDDMPTFVSSRFQPAPSVRNQTPPASESIRRIGPGDASGQLAVRLMSLRGAKSYELRWAQVASGGTPGAWVSQAVPHTRPDTQVANLTPGATYVFQARALLGSGFTDWSDSLTRICA